MLDEQEDYRDQAKHPAIACLGRFSAQLPNATAAIRLLVSSHRDLRNLERVLEGRPQPAGP